MMSVSLYNCGHCKLPQLVGQRCHCRTPEDEAFDELAKRQGMWGGGFQAKRAAAADKLQEPEREVLKLALEALEESWHLVPKPDYACEAITAIKAALAQPVQKIPYPVTGWKVEVRGSNQRLFITGVYGDTIFVDLPEAQPVQQVQEPVAHILQFIKELRPAIGPMAGMGKSKTTQEWFDIVINEIERLQTTR